MTEKFAKDDLDLARIKQVLENASSNGNLQEFKPDVEKASQQIKERKPN